MGVCSADSFINILLCMLGYLPGLIHSWYIIATHPPYELAENSKIYYVFQSQDNLESQRGNGRSNRADHCENHCDHHCDQHAGSVRENSRPVLVEPQPLAGPNYGSTSDQAAEGVPPPAYSELPGKN